MKLWCGKCYDRLGIAGGLQEHGEGKDHGAYATSTKKLRKGRWEPTRKAGIARRITARCLACGYRDRNGYIIAARKAG